MCIRGHVVRELPPPTPREAYLPQRPGHVHKRGNNYKQSKLSKQSEKLTRQSRVEERARARRPHLRRKQKTGSNP